MSLHHDRIVALSTAIGNAIQAVDVKVGDLTTLNTTDKSSTVAAINEALGSGGANINDAVTTTTDAWSGNKIAADIAASLAAAIAADLVINDVTASGTTVYSGTQVDAAIATAIANLAGTAPATLDAIDEIAAALQNNPDIITEILTSLGNRVRVDAAQAFTAPQQAQGRTNIAAADLAIYGADGDTDYVAIFNTALTD